MKNSKKTLNTFIAHAGVASRRAAAELIKDGFVTVNGKTQRNPAYRVESDDAVKVRNKLITPESYVYVLVNKPKGYVSTVSDEKGRRTVVQLVENQKIKARLYPVGRLDAHTTGLMLLTNDGQLAQRLAHPSFQIAKEYVVTLHKSMTTPDWLSIKKGVRLKDGLVKVDKLSRPYGPDNRMLRVTLHSGKYRVIRRMVESLGYFVDALDRVAYAGISKKGLPLGEWRFITQKELQRLKGVK